MLQKFKLTYLLGPNWTEILNTEFKIQANKYSDTPHENFKRTSFQVLNINHCTQEPSRKTAELSSKAVKCFNTNAYGVQEAYTVY